MAIDKLASERTMRGQSKAARRVAMLAGRFIERGSPEPEREYYFHFKRKWRFDLAWPALRVAVELQGGGFMGGRHSRGAGLASDCEKLTHAAAAGWVVILLTHGQAKDPEMIDVAASAVRWRQENGLI